MSRSDDEAYPVLFRARSALAVPLALGLGLMLGQPDIAAAQSSKATLPTTAAKPVVPRPAAPAPSATVDSGAKTYENCMALARTDPQNGFETGSQWRDQGGGNPAKHCVAVALINLKQYGEGATRLEQLAKDMGNSSPALRGDILDQAGQAWNLAGKPAQAQAALSQALSLEPGNPDILIDRAIVRAGQNQYREAIDDLTVALQRDHNRAEAFVYRATAYRFLDQLTPAEQDAERAVALGPTMPEAWLERGNIRRLLHKDLGARTDWLRVLSLTPEGAVADAARDNIAKLDVKVEPKASTKPKS